MSKNTIFFSDKLSEINSGGIEQSSISSNRSIRYKSLEKSLNSYRNNKFPISKEIHQKYKKVATLKNDLLINNTNDYISTTLRSDSGKKTKKYEPSFLHNPYVSDRFKSRINEMILNSFIPMEEKTKKELNKYQLTHEENTFKFKQKKEELFNLMDKNNNNGIYSVSNKKVAIFPMSKNFLNFGTNRNFGSNKNTIEPTQKNTFANKTFLNFGNNKNTIEPSKKDTFISRINNLHKYFDKEVNKNEGTHKRSSSSYKINSFSNLKSNRKMREDLELDDFKDFHFNRDFNNDYSTSHNYSSSTISTQRTPKNKITFGFDLNNKTNNNSKRKKYVQYPTSTTRNNFKNMPISNFSSTTTPANKYPNFKVHHGRTKTYFKF